MSGDEPKMTDMKPIKRKGSLLERADARYDFGGKLRRLEPGAVGDGPVIEARADKRAPAPRTPRRAAQPATPAVPHAAAPEAAAPPPAAPPPPAPEPVATAPVPVSAPERPAGTSVARAGSTALAFPRLEPGAAMQPINRQLLADHGLIDADGATGALAEEYRIVKRQLLRNSAGAHGRRILISSSQPDEGKTFSTINLALSLAAEHGVSVVVVDADFARQQVTEKLGLVAGKGLLDVLTDPDVRLADCVIPTDVPGLAVLPGGTSTARDTEVVNSARMLEVLAMLEAEAPDRIILFDTMPLLAASSTGVLAQLCGQVVVVVRADVTREAALRDAIGLIGQHHGICLLLNRVRFTPEGRRFGSYYGEGG